MKMPSRVMAAGGIDADVQAATLLLEQEDLIGIFAPVGRR